MQRCKLLLLGKTVVVHCNMMAMVLQKGVLRITIEPKSYSDALLTCAQAEVGQGLDQFSNLDYRQAVKIISETHAQILAHYHSPDYQLIPTHPPFLSTIRSWVSSQEAKQLFLIAGNPKQSPLNLFKSFLFITI